MDYDSSGLLGTDRGHQYYTDGVTNYYPKLNTGIDTSGRTQAYEEKQFYLGVYPSHMEVLKEGAGAFIADVAAKNATIADPAKKHRISIVKFATADYCYEDSNGNIVATDNVDIAGGLAIGDHKNSYDYNYTQVVKDLTVVDDAGRAELTTALNHMTSGGATAVDYGIQLAEKVLGARTDATGRSEAVIVFTDGAPTHDSDYSASVAGSAINEALALKNAGVVRTYTLTYESNGGTAYNKETYNRNTTVDINKKPVKEGYVFEGWYEDKELTKYVAEVKMTKDITVYAKWVEDNGGAGSGYDTPGSLNGEDHFAYVVGYPDGTVRPNDNISRAEVTAIFFRLLKPDEVRDKNLTSENNFSDVNDGDWHNAAISTMAKLGIVNGRYSDRFVPDAFITRAEFAAICARFDNSEFEVVDNFTDVQGHWAEHDIHEAAAHGWIRGYEDGTFKPDQFITRAEAMTMINRVLNRVPETADDLLDNMIHWPDNSDKSAWYYLTVQEATNSHEYEMKNHIYEKWTALREVTDWTKYE